MGDARSRVVVYHSGYGCDTGCCGHVFEMGDRERWTFNHPYGEDFRAWAEELVADFFGSEHVADLDWENCRVYDD